MNKYAIIVAGGSGSRMGNPIPKQFLPVNGYPIILHTLKKFLDFPEPTQIILVLPQSQFEEWKTICKTHHFNEPIKVVAGGSTRFQSVKNGLNAIPDNDNGLVAIHDGVRPFVSHEIIKNSFITAKNTGCAITSISLKDSIRSINGDKNKAEDRAKFKLIQTPQTFQLSLIKKAFETPELSEFTDDASVLEYSGTKIHLIEGSFENIKITSPDDLIIAEALVKKIIKR